MQVSSASSAGAYAAYAATAPRGVGRTTAPGAVQKSSTYVPVQPVPGVGVEREPGSFGPAYGTPSSLGTVDLIAFRPNTTFAVVTGEPPSSSAANPDAPRTVGGDAPSGEASVLPNGAPAEARAAGETEATPKTEATGGATSTGEVEGEDGEAEDPAAKRGADGQALTPEEAERVEELQARDREVRAHEQAHKAAAGPYGGAMKLNLERGPDGRSYATSGEVAIDVSPIEGDPQATITKMQTVRRAALAPAEPSAADRRVAAKASQYEQEARAQLRVQQAEEAKAAGDLASDGDADATPSASASSASASTAEPEAAAPPTTPSVERLRATYRF